MRRWGRARFTALTTVAFVAGYGSGLLAEPRSAGTQPASLGPAKRPVVAVAGVAASSTVLDGSYGGVGLWVRTVGDGRAAVSRVVAGSPAEAAGIRIGERLVEVGGVPTDRMAADRIAGLLRGPADSAVELLVASKGAGGTARRLRLVRRAVPVGDVQVHTDRAGVTHVRVSAFSAGVGRQVEAAVSGPRTRAVLLDLRGNPGGLVDEAVATADALLAAGTVVTYPGRDGRPNRRVAAPGGATGKPVVVLVDGATASAAEIVAAALRDHGRAVLVGTATYGKGTVGIASLLPNGSVRTRQLGGFVTPAGRSIDRVGVQPDVRIRSDAPPEAAFARAYQILTGGHVHVR